MKCKFYIINIILLLMLPFLPVFSSENPVNQNFQEALNSDGDETSCSLTSDNKTVYLARKPKGGQNSDIFFSEFKKGEWSQPVPAAELNSDADDISPMISKDGKMILFSSNRTGSLKSRNGASLSYDIYFSERKNGKWSKPEQLYGAVNTADNETYPFITADRSSLYFTRTSTDGSLKFSIIKVNKKDGSWEDVKAADVTKDKTIRISMAVKLSGRPGFILSGFKGGSKNREIFFTSGNGNSAVKLSGADAGSSAGDEISVFEINSRSLIVSTNSSGSYDLVIRSITPAVSAAIITRADLTIRTEFRNYSTPDDAELQILYFNTKNTDVMPVKSEFRKPDGNGEIKLKPGADIKRILVLPGNDDMKTFAVEIFPEKDELIPFITIENRTEEAFRLKPVYFSFNSSEPELTDIPFLQELIEYLRDNEDTSILINGYADGAGSCQANVSISLNRAEAMRDYLMKGGINKERIKTAGHGFIKYRPEDTKQYNRRVEFRFIE